MDDKTYYRISVKGVVVDQDGRFLLAKEDNGKWELLGGGLEHGEHPIKALKREIAEETGLEVTYVSPTPIYFVTAKRDGHDTYIANVIYEIKLKDLNFVSSEECIELKFFSPDESKKVNMFASVEQFVQAFDPRLHH